ncbi:MAG: hypothetical protein KGZ83_02945 [Sulfuricella sp.]|nr:hypothetical protein [Sulfuricella sp.]
MSKPPISLVLAFLLPVLTTGCGDLLPRGETVAESPWQSFEDAQQTFNQIVPRVTTVADLKRLKLDPLSNPNITLLNYSDVLRRFIPSPAIDPNDLEAGVRECLQAKSACSGYEVDQRSLKRKRFGNFWVDFLNFQRKTDIVGWRFNGVILIKDGVVIYKLTGGQPHIHEHEDSRNPLGPFQGIGESRLLNVR